MKDRILQIQNRRDARWRFFHHNDVVTNFPKTTTDIHRALVMRRDMAETIRFNLTARGFKVRMLFAEPVEPVCTVCELPGSKCGCEPCGTFV